MNERFKSELGRNPCKARRYDLIVRFQLLRINPLWQPAPIRYPMLYQSFRVSLSELSQQFLVIKLCLLRLDRLFLYRGLRRFDIVLRYMGVT